MYLVYSGSLSIFLLASVIFGLAREDMPPGPWPGKIIYTPAQVKTSIKSKLS